MSPKSKKRFQKKVKTVARTTMEILTNVYCVSIWELQDQLIFCSKAKWEKGEKQDEEGGGGGGGGGGEERNDDESDVARTQEEQEE